MWAAAGGFGGGGKKLGRVGCGRWRVEFLPPDSQKHEASDAFV